MKHLYAILPLLALSCPIALASTDSTDTDFLGANSSPAFAISAEAFYGFDMSDNDVDILGVQFRRSLYTLSINQNTSLDAFAALQVGYGDDATSVVDVWGLFISAIVGTNVSVRLTDRLSLFARAQFGVNCTRTHFDTNDDEDTDFAWGFAYGGGAGLQYGVTLTQSIIVAVDYIGTTSEPEAKIHAYKIKADEPEYITLSVGYKFSF